MIPLEDTYLDIIKKAAVGHGLGEKKIAELSQVPITKINDFFNGAYCIFTLQAIAQILNLDFQSLKAHAEGHSQPPEILLEGLLQYQSIFTYRPNQTLSVNHYLLSMLVPKRLYFLIQVPMPMTLYNTSKARSYHFQLFLSPINTETTSGR